MSKKNAVDPVSEPSGTLNDGPLPTANDADLLIGACATGKCFKSAATCGKGASGFTAGFTTGNCQAVYEDLKGKGVEITQEPVTHFYGTDIGIRDPFGNHLRIVQLAAPQQRQ